MIKTLTTVACLFLLAASFELRADIRVPSPEEQVASIPWPYTVCGDGDWTIESLSLAATPKRNQNNDMTVVKHIFYLDWNSE